MLFCIRGHNLTNIIATINDDLQLRARTQGRLLSIDIPNDLPTIATDRTSLSEVIANLIDNAIKYSREGGQVVALGYRLRGNGEEDRGEAGLQILAEVRPA